MPRKKVELNLDGAEEKKTRRRKKSEEVVKEKKPKSAKKMTKKETQIHAMAAQTKLPEHYFMVWTPEQLDECMEWLWQQPVLAVDTETMGLHAWKDEIVGISFYAPHRGYYIPLKHKDNIDDDSLIPSDVYDAEGNRVRDALIGHDYVKCLPKELVIKKLKPLLEDRSKKFLGHNCKFDSHVIRNWLGIFIEWFFDTMVACKLLDENKSARLKDIAPIYLKVEAEKFGSLFGKTTFDKVPVLYDPVTRLGSLAGYYATYDTELTYKLYEFQMKHLSNPKLSVLHYLMFDIEMPFLHIVIDAEAHGVALDENYLVNKVAVELHADLERLRQQIWAYTGVINLNAPAQKAEALYVKLGLPRVNEEKPNSTDKKTMKKLRKHHKVIDLMIEYSEKNKLTTAFADKLPKAVVEGRIHTSFNSVGTKTGRMSSNSPNLQQIPAKVGGLIRNAFISDSGRLLASIDFSQQELRVLAHVSQDEVLLNAYRDGLDIHSLTASGMFNAKFPEWACNYGDFEYYRGMKDLFLDQDGKLVEEKLHDAEYIDKHFEAGDIRTKDADELKDHVKRGIYAEKTRKDAKVINFGIIYGMSKYKLAETLEITVDEAQEYIDAYFAQYPGVQRWMQQQRFKMQKGHFTETMLGRKRRVYEEMKAEEFWKVQRGFRQGINAVIQGSSADMVKIASVQLQPLLKELDVRIVLWVHDEIIYDVPEGIGIDALKRIADVMCNALPLDCGLKSDIEVGAKWGQRMKNEDLEELYLVRQATKKISGEGSDFDDDDEDDEEQEDAA
jgi:DNA polymerase-1